MKSTHGNPHHPSGTGSSDDEEYGGSYLYSSNTNNAQRPLSSRAYASTRYPHRSTSGGGGSDYASSSSPNRGSMSGPGPNNLPLHHLDYGTTTRSYRTPQPTTGYGGNPLVETYSTPPCCHQYYQSTPSHFNTIPHPPVQYRDLPQPPPSNSLAPLPSNSSTTLNRSYANPRSSSRNSSAYYYPSANDPGNQIYTPTHDPILRAGGGGNEIYYTTRRRYTPSSVDSMQHSGGESTKLYDPPPPPIGYRSTGHYITPNPSILRQFDVIEPGSSHHHHQHRIYSSPALPLGGGSMTSGIRSNSPLNPNFNIDRSISLIRLDNSNTGPSSGGMILPPPPPHSNVQEANSRIKYPTSTVTVPCPSNDNPSSSSTGIQASPMQISSSSNPNKPKFKIIIDPNTPKIQAKPKPNSHTQVVEMFDKAVMTVQSGSGDEQNSGSNGNSSANESPSSRMDLAQQQPTALLPGGVPDLLPAAGIIGGRGIGGLGNESCGNASWRSSSGLLTTSQNNFQLPNPSSSSSPLRRGNFSRNKNSSSSQQPNNSSSSAHSRSSGPSRKFSKFKAYVRNQTKIFFGLVDENDGNELKEEWLSRRKRFASRRYSERNVDSMPPPSPYQTGQRVGHVRAGDHTDGTLGSGRPIVVNRLRKQKDCVFIIYWNLIRWIFWSIRFGRYTGLRVLAGAGCGSDTNPGSTGSITPGRVPLNSQMSRDRTKSRSITPNTLGEIPTNVTVSSYELFFDDLLLGDDGIVGGGGSSSIHSGAIGPHLHHHHNLPPPNGRGLHWRISPSTPSPSSNRISPQFLNKILDNSERQQYRHSLARHFSPTTSSALTDEYEDFRPYFTYWVSIVQIIILIVSMITYGIAPVGVDLHRKSALVLVTSLSLQQMEIVQPANFWIGPSAGDLIHLGAKYSPCMRRDPKIYRRIIETRDQERQTACCIRNDNSGCVQSSRNECSIKGVSRTGLLSTWKKWTGKEIPGGGRISGSVCGLDPKFCEAPASIAPYEWPDDITKWPICRKTRGLSGMNTKDKTAEHMVCEVIGHPCCIGIHAKCVITTREYCRFVSGYFHEEASLCSQVSCLQDICGLFPFLAGDSSPDQFYRLISSLFLHAGLGHLSITLLFHWFILRDLEKLAGPLRISIIYFGSGIAGNLASVLLEPHRAEVGPGGSQYGLLACLLVELLHMWSVLRRPWQALGKMLLVTGSLLLIGFLPWVDNFAHLVGFCTGFLLSHALMPYIVVGKYSLYRKWLEVLTSLGGFLTILISLLIIFYAGFGDCEWCRLLNCLPLTQDFCAEQEIDLKPSGGGINLIT